VGGQELEMAERLVELLEAPFEPEEIKDHYRESLIELIEAKREGEEIKAAPEPKGKVVDLMAALKASVEAARSSKKGGGRRKDEEEERKPARRRKAS
jgi:DNA end-binding protein Ku